MNTVLNCEKPCLRRNVEILLTPDFAEVVSGFDKRVVEAAISYLALWALGSDRYLSCKIYGDKEGNLDATYTNGKGETTYQIGGILREDNSYSFHS